MTVNFFRSRRTTFGRDGHPALKCHPDGMIQANTFGEAKQWEEFTLHIVDEEKSIVALQSWTGKYLTAYMDGNVGAHADEINDWEKWEMKSTSEHFVSLKSCHGKFLACDGRIDCGREVRANRDEAKEWEEWMVVNDRNALTVPGATIRKAGIGIAAAGTLTAMGALAIPAAGFGAGGVAAGSMAAAAQSAIYGATTGGAFSVLQSAGATLAWVPFAAGGTAAAAGGAAAALHQPPGGEDGVGDESPAATTTTTPDADENEKNPLALSDHTVVIFRSRRTTFGRDGHPALKCHPDGAIQANTFGEAKQWEEFTLHIVDEEKSIVALQSWTGKYLTAYMDGNVGAHADEINDWEKWELKSTSENFVSLKSYHGKFLACDGRSIDCGREVRANRDEAKEWEEWMVVNDRNALTDPGATIRKAGIGIAAAGTLTAMGALAIPAAGFGAGGVAAGSMAAAAQSAIYGATTGGAFSVLQSAGATLAWIPFAAAGGTAAVAGGAAAALHQPAGGKDGAGDDESPPAAGDEEPVDGEEDSPVDSAGSNAAATQSAIYAGGATTGGAFSVLQSAGAATLAWIPFAAAGVTAAVAGGAAAATGREDGAGDDESPPPPISSTSE